MQQQQDIKAIFDSFDLDKSGTVDLKQIGNVAAKLGKNLAPEQLAKIMKQLDINKDGKISYQQFEYWWTKGMVGGMAELVLLKAKAMKMRNFVQKKFTQANISFQGHKGNPKPDKYSFKVSFGNSKEDSVKINLGLYVKGQKEKQLKQQIKDYIVGLNNKTLGIVLKFPSKKPSQAKAALDMALNSIIHHPNFPVKVKSIQQNPFLILKTIVRQKQLLVQLTLNNQTQNIVAPMSTEVEAVLDQIGEGFYSLIQANFSINASSNQIIEKQMIDNILKGFQFGLQIQSNNSALSKLRKLAEKQQLQIPAFGNLITLLRCAKFHLKIKSPEHLQSFFKKLGIDDVVGAIPTVKDLLQQISPGARQALGKDFLTDLLYKFSKYIFKHIQDNVQIFLLGGDLGTGVIRLKGKNITKLHCILFNQS